MSGLSGRRTTTTAGKTDTTTRPVADGQSRVRDRVEAAELVGGSGDDQVAQGSGDVGWRHAECGG